MAPPHGEATTDAGALEGASGWPGRGYWRRRRATQAGDGGMAREGVVVRAGAGEERAAAAEAEVDDDALVAGGALLAMAAAMGAGGSRCALALGDGSRREGASTAHGPVLPTGVALARWGRPGLLIDTAPGTARRGGPSADRPRGSDSGRSETKRRDAQRAAHHAARKRKALPRWIADERGSSGRELEVRLDDLQASAASFFVPSGPSSPLTPARPRGAGQSAPAEPRWPGLPQRQPGRRPLTGHWTWAASALVHSRRRHAILAAAPAQPYVLLQLFSDLIASRTA
ncbi:hypothetical protein BDY21DRAFT_396309 [Lineolata rhizophorae]|uniref:Uncharacterized protein n=1 Tax=Lineolata rhizophorae TaxID=578093 RepID=A0A6A6NVC0_9PEZI|nr:hypothetical protein BDY21DRAFT_396309 [Lineolata rhizophorae]